LLLTPRKLQRVGVHLVVQPHRLQGGEGPPLLLARRHPEDPQDEGHVLEDGLALESLETTPIGTARITRWG
jgi:hypothetical protein